MPEFESRRSCAVNGVYRADEPGGVAAITGVMGLRTLERFQSHKNANQAGMMRRFSGEVASHLLIGSRQLQPVPAVETPNHGRFLDKRIVNPLMVYGRRLRPAIGPIMPDDEFPSHRADASRKPRLIAVDRLQEVAILHRSYRGGVPF